MYPGSFAMDFFFNTIPVWFWFIYLFVYQLPASSKCSLVMPMYRSIRSTTMATNRCVWLIIITIIIFSGRENRSQLSIIAPTVRIQIGIFTAKLVLHNLYYIVWNFIKSAKQLFEPIYRLISSYVCAMLAYNRCQNWHTPHTAFLSLSISKEW